MAAPLSEFAAYVVETLAALGDVRARRMFGGYGLTCDGLTFALIADEVLYLKADDANRAEFEAQGLRPFKPFPDKPMVMSYYPLPDAGLDDPDEMRAWGRSGLGAALRAAAAKAEKARKAKKKAGATQTKG